MLRRPGRGPAVLSPPGRTVQAVTVTTAAPPAAAADGRSLAGVAAAVRAGWSPATAAPGKWDQTLSAAGQCAVTALVVQDLLGGSLLRGTVGGESHYWNRVDGADVDLTREQFPEFALDGPPEPRDRSYVLSFPDTAARYRLLRRRVRRALAA